MNDELDAMLRTDVLQPPPDFTQRVMKNLPMQIHASQLVGRTEARVTAPSDLSHAAPLESRPQIRPESRLVFRQRWRGLVMHVGWASARVLGLGLGAAVGAVVGLTQLASFVFGLWLSATAL